jgi:hypothetical protein
VNKHSERYDYLLEEVMQTGRKDIAKRLKYTKDIMYRLINSGNTNSNPNPLK